MLRTWSDHGCGLEVCAEAFGLPAREAGGRLSKARVVLELLEHVLVAGPDLEHFVWGEVVAQGVCHFLAGRAEVLAPAFIHILLEIALLGLGPERTLRDLAILGQVHFGALAEARACFRKRGSHG